LELEEMTVKDIHQKWPAEPVKAIDMLAARDMLDRTSWVVWALTSMCA
jgi:hypothetical protein